MKKDREQSSAPIFAFGAIAVVLGLIAFVLGWTAQSEGNLWHTGRSARLGVETSTPTLSWMIYGVLLILAGIIPWKWLTGRFKR